MHTSSLRYQSNRLRAGRFSEAGRIYLITTTTWRRRRLFESLGNSRIVVRSLGHLQHENRALTYAYVVMPDHLHWLAGLGEGETLERVIHSVKSYSAKAIMRNEDSLERVWQSGYHDRALRRTEDLKTVARYVIANPLRAGLVSEIGQYSHWDACWVNGDDVL